MELVFGDSVNLLVDWQADEANADKRFPTYARMLERHGTPEAESRYSWTLDFAARRAKAREDMEPLRDEAARLSALGAGTVDQEFLVRSGYLAAESSRDGGEEG